MSFMRAKIQNKIHLPHGSFCFFLLSFLFVLDSEWVQRGLKAFLCLGIVLLLPMLF